jgi:Xaa-Pro aminopeptidase
MFEARFQSFEDRAERAASGPRVAALRTELARRDLTGWIVPRSDRQQNEYVPACEERLAWLTGFTGSAGAAIVLMDRAVLFVDGRYTLQAREQVDPSLFAIEHLVEMPLDRWIEANLSPGDRPATIPGCTRSRARTGWARPARPPPPRWSRSSPT